MANEFFVRVIAVLLCLLATQSYLVAQDTSPAGSDSQQSEQQVDPQQSLLLRLSNLQKQLEQQSDSPELWFELTLAYVELGELENALNAMLNAVKYIKPAEGIKVVHPSDFNAENKEIYFTAIRQMKLKQTEEALQLLESLKKKQPDSPEIYYNLSVMYGNEGQYVDFFENLYAGASLDKSIVEYFRIVGGIHVLLGNLDTAETMFGKALEIDENYSAAYVWLGKLRLIEHKYDEGIYILQKAVEADPNEYSARLTLGRMYMELKQFDKAKTMLEEAVQLNKYHWEAYRTLGYLYYYLDDIDKSIKMFKEVIVLQPNKIDPLLDLARVYQNKGFHAEAISLIKSALKMMPNEPMLYVELAEMYAASEDYQMAMESFQNALTINNEMPVIHYRLGLVYYKLQKPQEAVQELKKAIRMEPEYIDAYKALYYLYRDELKDEKEAAYYSQMLEILGAE